MDDHGDRARDPVDRPGNGSAAENDPVAAILDVIRQGEKFLVCSHSRPDGDAVGSMLATGMLLDQMGKRADLVTADRIPSIYRALPGADAIRTAMRVHGPYDAVILLECDGLERTRLRGLEPFFHINIDHHATGRRFAPPQLDRSPRGQRGRNGLPAGEGRGRDRDSDMATCLYTTDAHRYRRILLRRRRAPPHLHWRRN